MRKSNKLATLLVFMVVVCIALVAVLSGKKKASRCDYDGAVIERIYEVVVTFDDNSTKHFCSIVCAKMDLKDEANSCKFVTVTDEISAKKIDAKLAYFVESEIVTVLHVGNNIHVFQDKKRAKKHAAQFGGRIVENPFTVCE